MYKEIRLFNIKLMSRAIIIDSDVYGRYVCLQHRHGDEFDVAEAAVDVVDAAGDEGGIVGAEEKSEFGDFVWSTHAADRLSCR